MAVCSQDHIARLPSGMRPMKEPIESRSRPASSDPSFSQLWRESGDDHDMVRRTQHGRRVEKRGPDEQSGGRQRDPQPGHVLAQRFGTDVDGDVIRHAR